MAIFPWVFVLIFLIVIGPIRQSQRAMNSFLFANWLICVGLLSLLFGLWNEPSGLDIVKWIVASAWFGLTYKNPLFILALPFVVYFCLPTF